jgi:hypothetical protein
MWLSPAFSRLAGADVRSFWRDGGAHRRSGLENIAPVSFLHKAAQKKNKESVERKRQGQPSITKGHRYREVAKLEP